MSDLHEGRVAATFQMGRRVEDRKEAYEKEVLGLDGMKLAYNTALKLLEELHEKIVNDVKQSKLPVKEGDVAEKYIIICIEVLQRLFRDTEIKRVATVGAVDALNQVVNDAKRMWDNEQEKLRQVREFEAATPMDIKNRPVGYMPKEHPLEEYKKPETSSDESKVPSRPKKTRKKPADA